MRDAAARRSVTMAEEDGERGQIEGQCNHLLWGPLNFMPAESLANI